jgi:hypothetical protein
MSIVQKIGGVAAFINAAVSVATLVVAFGLIGLPALTDRHKLVELAISDPTPLIIQDVLKFVLAAIAIVLISAVFNRLNSDAPKLMGVATVCGSLAVLCLVINAGLSFFLVSQATNYALVSSDTSNQLHGVIGLLGLAVIFLNGVWYLLISWSALKYKASEAAELSWVRNGVAQSLAAVGDSGVATQCRVVVGVGASAIEKLGRTS